jgi:MarR family transcriptional regulator, 2-MHQ and catechol-resistance regulon repressor
MKPTDKYGKKASLALDMYVKLVRATGTFNKLTGNDIQKFGLTQPQFGVIETLGHLGSLTMGEICSKMLVSGGNITVVIDNLEKEGLVERVPSTKDRRTIFVRLTTKGKKLFDEIFVKHAECITNLASALTESEQTQLARLVKKLGLALKKKT